MIQAISEIDPDQAIPFLTYIRQHSSTPVKILHNTTGMYFILPENCR